MSESSSTGHGFFNEACFYCNETAVRYFRCRACPGPPENLENPSSRYMLCQKCFEESACKYCNYRATAEDIAIDSDLPSNNTDPSNASAVGSTGSNKTEPISKVIAPLNSMEGKPVLMTVSQENICGQWDLLLLPLVDAAISKAVLFSERPEVYEERHASILSSVSKQLESMGIRVMPGALDLYTADILQMWENACVRIARSPSQICEPAKEDIEPGKEIGELVKEELGLTGSARFTSDPWRYQKEARQYYQNPVEAFATELLQNSLDAMAAIGIRHEMEVICSVKVVNLGNETCPQHRIVVSFEDNGQGMDHAVIKGGLLCVGASEDTRADSGKKNNLNEAAGGFGLAKVLLYLGQSGFDICTKMKDGVEFLVSAENFRKDREKVHIQEVCKDDQYFKIKHHGTKSIIYLDPWVMETKTWIDSWNLNDSFYEERESGLSYYSQPEDYVAKFKHVWRSSNLPIKLTVNEKKVNLKATPGTFQTYIYMPGSKRRFAALYAKEVSQGHHCIPEAKVVLQALSSRLQPDHNFSDSAGCFLYLCDLNMVKGRSITLTKRMELTVMLFTCDEQGKPFKCGEVLQGTRDELANKAKAEVTKQIQAYVIDRYSVRPPTPKVNWLGHASQGFSDWLKQKKPEPDPENSPERTKLWWIRVTKKEADEYFGGKHWRDSLEYKYLVYKDPCWSGSRVPLEFQSIETAKPLDLMWMELFGVLIREVMDAFKKDMIKNGKTIHFHIGFYIGERDFVRPINCEDAEAKKVAFVYNKSYVKRLAERYDELDYSDFDVVVNVMTALKSMAIREVAFHLEGILDGAEAFEVFQRYYVRFDQGSLTRDWSWFAWYKSIVERRFMRESQDGQQLHNLKRHVVAMQSPIPDEKTSREILQHECNRLQKENVELQIGSDEMMPNPLMNMTKMSPKEIRFTKESCFHYFRCGRQLTETARELAEGAISADINIPLIEVFNWGNHWYTTGNRRLWSYRHAEVQKVPVRKVDVPPKLIERLVPVGGGLDIEVLDDE